MPIKYCCHCCGRSDSLNKIEEEGAWVCSKCWELIIIIVSKWYSLGAKVLDSDFDTSAKDLADKLVKGKYLDSEETC